MATRALSERAARMLAMPKPPFTAIYYEHLGKFYDPVDNPEGLVNLAVAENRLASPLLQERLRRIKTCGASPSSLAYNPYIGSDAMRKAMARVLSRHVAKCHTRYEHLQLTNGTGSALWLLSAVLAEPGDGVLIPTPYYYAYDRDFTALCDCRIVPVKAASGQDPYELSNLSAIVDEAQATGIRSRLLVVTSPDNPTGAVVPPEKMRALISWAADRGIDVISNEIYACTASAKAGSFRSVLDLYRNGAGEAQLPSHVHFVWGASKDFAANGLRCACIYTDSEVVREAASKFLYFMQVGGPVQEQLAECFNDDAWVDEFLAESRHKLAEAVQATLAALDALEVPYIVPEGSLFVWADFSRYIASAGGELSFFKQLAALPGGGLLLCPGSTFHADTEGWFRICVTAAPEGHLQVGLQRLQHAVTASAK